MAVAGTLEIDVVLNGKKAKIGLDELKKRLGFLEKNAKSANKIFGKLAKFASIGFLAKMTIDATKFGRSMSLLADRTGIATEKLLGMRSAFSAMGGKAGSIDRLLGSISKGLAGLSFGKGEYASKLASMGIQAWGANGKVKSADVVMGDIADWTKNQLAMGRSNAEVAAFLEDAFGIDYETFKLLSLGRVGMEQKQKQMAEKTGTVEERQAENLNSLYKSVALLNETLSVFRNKIAGDIAPIFEFVGNLLQYLFKELQTIWDDLSKTYRDLVGDGEAVADLFKGLKTVLKWGLIEPLKEFSNYIKMIMVGFRKFGELIAWIVDKFSWVFSSVDEKDQHLAALHSQEALKMKFNSPEERLSWLASKGSTFWRQRYEEFLEKKKLESELIYNDSEIVQEDYEQPALPTGVEVISANMSDDGKLFVEVNNNTEITQNPDGSFTNETTTEVSGNGIDLSKRVLSNVTGVK